MVILRLEIFVRLLSSNADETFIHIIALLIIEKANLILIFPYYEIYMQEELNRFETKFRFLFPISFFNLSIILDLFITIFVEKNKHIIDFKHIWIINDWLLVNALYLRLLRSIHRRTAQLYFIELKCIYLK